MSQMGFSFTTLSIVPPLSLVLLLLLLIFLHHNEIDGEIVAAFLDHQSTSSLPPIDGEIATALRFLLSSSTLSKAEGAGGGGGGADERWREEDNSQVLPPPNPPPTSTRPLGHSSRTCRRGGHRLRVQTWSRAALVGGVSWSRRTPFRFRCEHLLEQSQAPSRFRRCCNGRRMECGGGQRRRMECSDDFFSDDYTGRDVRDASHDLCRGIDHPNFYYPIVDCVHGGGVAALAEATAQETMSKASTAKAFAIRLQGGKPKSSMTYKHLDVYRMGTLRA